jgi:hypothetical protein
MSKSAPAKTMKNQVPPADRESVAAAPQAYRALKDFSSVVGDVMVRITARKVFTDRRLIDALLAVGAPIVPVGEETDVVVCPCCKHIFSNTNVGGNAAA